jgi:nucleoside-diphosphate-sugar epimerase
MKKKILICGATGFIGRNIVEYFASRGDVEVFGTYFNSSPLDYPNVKMLRADLTDKVQVDRVVEGMDIIIQAAATTSGAKDIVNKPYYHVTYNAVMNSLIFRAAFEYKVSNVVFFSCTVMYQQSDTPLREFDFDANKEIYHNYFGVGWTKVYIEKMCEFYSRLGNTKYTVIRHSNIYGPYDKYDLEKSHVFGATITKVMTTEEGGKIIVWGTGEEGRDLLYVSDLVDFVTLALERQESSFELINVGYGEAVSVADLVRKIVFCSGKNLDVEYDLSKPTIKTKLCLDATKAKKILGWSPRVSLEEGIRKTMVWYKTNRELIRGEYYDYQ